MLLCRCPALKPCFVTLLDGVHRIAQLPSRCAGAALTGRNIGLALRALDWIPVVGTVKNIAQLFAWKAWKPVVASLSEQKKALYHHIHSQSPLSTLVLAVPVVGAVAAIWREGPLIGNKVKVKLAEWRFERSLHKGDPLDPQAFTGFQKRAPEEQAKHIEICFRTVLSDNYLPSKDALAFLIQIMLKTPQHVQKIELWLMTNLVNNKFNEEEERTLMNTPSVPLSIRKECLSRQIVEVCLNNSSGIFSVWEKQDNDGRAHLLGICHQKAEQGEEVIWQQLGAMYRNVDPKNRKSLLDFFKKTAQEFSSPNNEKALKLLTEICGSPPFPPPCSINETREIIAFYITVMQSDRVPESIGKALNEILFNFFKQGNGEQKQIILTHYEHFRAHVNLESILAVGDFYYFKGEFAIAADWYAQAGEQASPGITERLKRIRRQLARRT